MQASVDPTPSVYNNHNVVYDENDQPDYVHTSDTNTAPPKIQPKTNTSPTHVVETLESPPPCFVQSSQIRDKTPVK